MTITYGRLLDAAGRPRSPATMPGYHAGRPPRNKGMRYPADPPRVEEIVAVMRQAGRGVHGARVRALIVVLWRAGLRIAEALSLAEGELDPGRGALLVRHGKAGKRGRRAASFRAAPASPRARRGDGSRGRTAKRDPAPARPCRPWRHLGVSAGNRQHRGDQRGSFATSADDAGERGPAPVADGLLVIARSSSRGLPSRALGAGGAERAALIPRTPRSSSGSWWSGSACAWGA